MPAVGLASTEQRPRAGGHEKGLTKESKTEERDRT
jgi:hypothetical protein